MEERDENQSSESGREDGEAEAKEEENVLQFLDSMDSYLILLDSLSSTLRQGWLELASARQSMGASRVTSALFDLKLHSAATTVQVAHLDDESPTADPMAKQPHFTLSKWETLNDGRHCHRDIEVNEGDLQKKLNSPQLRRRGPSQFSELQENSPASNGAAIIGDDKIQKERSKSLSIFGTLVSPKLRSSQLSFEAALEKVVQIANMRSLMLSAYAQIQPETDDILD